MQNYLHIEIKKGYMKGRYTIEIGSIEERICSFSISEAELIAEIKDSLKRLE